MHNLAKFEIYPMLKSLLRQPYRAFMVIIQLAITMAILSNAIFIVVDRFQFTNTESGADEANTFSFISEGFTSDFPMQASVEQDLLFMRNLPGVVSAVQSNSVPYNESYSYTELQTIKGENADIILSVYYQVDEFGLDTFDLSLLAGENFEANEIVWQQTHDYSLPIPILLSQSVAENLFGHSQWQSIVGKTIYHNFSKPLIIKGVYDKLDAPSPALDYVNNTVLTPIRIIESQTSYVVRTEAGKIDEVMRELEHQLTQLNSERRVRSFESIQEAKQRAFAKDYVTIQLIGCIVIIVVLVTTIGIFGLVAMNISASRHQIGIRRALGASQGMIVCYYMLENLLLSILGTFIGAMLAVLLNMQLVQRYGLAPLEFVYLSAGIVIVVLISLFAAFIPAYKGARLSPAEATRHV